MSLDVTALRESFALVAAKELTLATRFYEILFERYPAVKGMFGKARKAVSVEAMNAAIATRGAQAR